MDENNENRENVPENETVVSETPEVRQDSVNNAGGQGVNDSDNKKLMGVLCYLSFLVLIPYFSDNKDEWLRHHTVQGMNIFILELISCVAYIIPFIGYIVAWVISLYTFVISIMGIINVVNNEDRELPLLNYFKFIKN